MMKSIRKSLAVWAVIALLAVLASLPACAPQPTQAPPPTEAPATAAPAPTPTPAPAKEEQITLTIWWWGEQEAPGAQAWLEETIAEYQKLHPNIKIQHVLQTTDGLIPAFKAAAEAKQGPDIQYFWGGVWTLEDAWAGSLVPLSDYWPESEIKHLISNEERMYDGKLWGMAWYLSGNSIAYNKALLAKVGVDTEKPFTTWDEFLTVCQKLKDAGITPLAGGVKDGWFGGWLWQLLEHQALDSADELKAASIGEYKFTDPKFADWWKRLQELRDKGYWNPDITSLDYQQGQDLWVQGQAAMIFGNDTFYKGWMDLVGEENFGVAKIPVWGKGKLAGGYVVTAQGLGITSWSPHKQEAADFLLFMHTPDRLNAWYKHTGVFPADDRFDPNQITSPIMRQIFQWIVEKPNPNLENFAPSMLDEQANFVGVQRLLAGEIDAEQAAQLSEEVIQKWRSQNPDAVEHFKKWLGK